MAVRQDLLESLLRGNTLPKPKKRKARIYSREEQAAIVYQLLSQHYLLSKKEQKYLQRLTGIDAFFFALPGLKKSSNHSLEQLLDEEVSRRGKSKKTALTVERVKKFKQSLEAIRAEKNVENPPPPKSVFNPHVTISDCYDGLLQLIGEKVEAYKEQRFYRLFNFFSGRLDKLKLAAHFVSHHRETREDLKHPEWRLKVNTPRQEVDILNQGDALFAKFKYRFLRPRVVRKLGKWHRKKVKTTRKALVQVQINMTDIANRVNEGTLLWNSLHSERTALVQLNDLRGDSFSFMLNQFREQGFPDYLRGNVEKLNEFFLLVEKIQKKADELLQLKSEKIDVIGNYEEVATEIVRTTFEGQKKEYGLFFSLAALQEDALLKKQAPATIAVQQQITQFINFLRQGDPLLHANPKSYLEQLINHFCRLRYGIDELKLKDILDQHEIEQASKKRLESIEEKKINYLVKEQQVLGMMTPLRAATNYNLMDTSEIARDYFAHDAIDSLSGFVEGQGKGDFSLLEANNKNNKQAFYSALYSLDQMVKARRIEFSRRMMLLINLGSQYKKKRGERILTAIGGLLTNTRDNKHELISTGDSYYRYLKLFKEKLRESATSYEMAIEGLFQNIKNYLKQTIAEESVIGLYEVALRDYLKETVFPRVTTEKYFMTELPDTFNLSPSYRQGLKQLIDQLLADYHSFIALINNRRSFSNLGIAERARRISNECDKEMAWIRQVQQQATNANKALKLIGGQGSISVPKTEALEGYCASHLHSLVGG